MNNVLEEKCNSGDDKVSRTTVTSTDHHLSKIGDISFDERVKRKAKRLLKQHSLTKDGPGHHHHHHHTSGDGVAMAVKSTRWKNSRKSRSGYKRGLPKKGGAGGKGVWGKLGSESATINEDTVDKNDPNYDSDNAGNVEFACVIPEISDEELKKQVELSILEYFEHGDTEEALLSLQELNCKTKRYMIVQLMIETALDRKPSNREMTSVLLADLCGGGFLKAKEVAKGFEELLANLPDLVLDTPDAMTVLGNFLARAVADACFDAEDLTNRADSELAQGALDRAGSLLATNMGLYNLDKIWGMGGGLRPVKTLIRQMNMLLEEYLSSGDVQEATRCLLELEVPHFYHELVYEAIVIVLESMNNDVDAAMCMFLKSLSDAIIITPDMMSQGFLRVYEDMPDIILDVPLAYTILERFVDLCHKNGFVSADLMKKMPARGRKRFVSEGDGGRLKE